MLDGGGGSGGDNDDRIIADRFVWLRLARLRNSSVSLLTHTTFPARLSGSALPSPMWADTDNVDVCLIVKDPQVEWEEAVEACGKFPCFRGVGRSVCVCVWFVLVVGCSCFVEISTLTHPPPPTTTISTTPTTIGADVALVLSVSQLRKNYKQFEARRKLLGAFVRSFRFPFFSFFFLVVVAN